MTKKKAKGKTAAKPAAKKKSAVKDKQELNPAEMRSELADMVGLAAVLMTQAVIDEGKKGQLATVKYLLEMAQIYPLSTDGSHATENEDSLARTLLNRLDIPDEPIARDEEDAPKAATSGVKDVVKAAAKAESETKAKNSGSEAETDNDKRDSAVV
jgi:hypothetical protein